MAINNLNNNLKQYESRKLRADVQTKLKYHPSQGKRECNSISG